MGEGAKWLQCDKCKRRKADVRLDGERDIPLCDACWKLLRPVKKRGQYPPQVKEKDEE